MSESIGTVARKERTKIILAVISMITAITISAISLVSQYLDKGEEKADAAYKHLVEQVHFTDRQLIEIRKEIVEGDKSLREMIFNLTLNMTKYHEKENSNKAENVKSSLVDEPAMNIIVGMDSDSLDNVDMDFIDKAPDNDCVQAIVAKKMEQRPLLPARLD